MKKFHFVADTTIDAEDLNDCFFQLSEHFAAIECGEEDILEHKGKMTIKPVEVKK